MGRVGVRAWLHVSAAHRARIVKRPSLKNQRAQGMPGASASTHSLACDDKKHTSKVATGESRITGIPRAMVLTVSFVISPVSMTSSSPSPSDQSVSGPSGPTSRTSRFSASQGAPGPHDFAVRAQHRSSVDAPRPSHPALNVRDDREAPLLSSAGRGELVEMICPTGIAKYFCEKDWTGQIRLNCFEKFVFTRTLFSRAPEMPLPHIVGQ
jgi:hypothetical protein